MTLQSLEWRRQYKIDTLLQDFESPEVFQKYFAAGFVGVDKAHNPRKMSTYCSVELYNNALIRNLVWVVRYGKIDMKGILHSAKKKDYLYHVYTLVETSIEASKQYKKKHNLPSSFMPQSTIIFDMEDFAMRHITYKPGDFSFSFVLFI